MTILVWLALGAVAGWGARRAGMGASFGLVGYVSVCVLGALAGGVTSALLVPAASYLSGLDMASVLVAGVGACVLLRLLAVLDVRGRPLEHLDRGEHLEHVGEHD